jgi:hypothetical protein
VKNEEPNLRAAQSRGSIGITSMLPTTLELATLLYTVPLIGVLYAKQGTSAVSASGSQARRLERKGVALKH